MSPSADFCLPVFGSSDDSQTRGQNKSLSSQDAELAKELIQKIQAFQKVSLGQRLSIAVFTSGKSRNTAWMMEGAKEGFVVKEPEDRCYKICKMIAKQGFIRAMDFSSKLDNV